MMTGIEPRTLVNIRLGFELVTERRVLDLSPDYCFALQAHFLSTKPLVLKEPSLLMLVLRGRLAAFVIFINPFVVDVAKAFFLFQPTALRFRRLFLRHP